MSEGGADAEQQERNLAGRSLRNLLAAGAIIFTLAPTVANGQAPLPAGESAVTAIVIAVDPDQVMVQHARDVNARLRKNYPPGFVFDSSHFPHITLLQRFVRTAELEKVCAAAGKVTANEQIGSWKLKALALNGMSDQDIGLAGIVLEPNGDMLRLQHKLIDAVAPFSVEMGTADAFVRTPEASAIDQRTMNYVAAFVPEASGKNFHPHLTVGAATGEYLRKLLGESFTPFTFSPAGVSIYQLGNNGTARKKLAVLPDNFN